MAPAAQRPRPPADTAAHATVSVLAAAGIRRCYTVPGESFLELADAIDQHPEMALVSTRHEGGAAFMAEAEAKLTGVPAVAAATRGPGAANLAVGVHTAMQDSTPMIVFLGQAETERLGREAFQEVDLTAFYAPITKWSTTVHRADRLAEVTARLQQVRSELPAEAEPPAIEVQRADRPYASFYLSFTSSERTVPAVTDWLLRTLQPQLSTLSDVQRVTIEGGRQIAMRIWIDPDRESVEHLRAATPEQVAAFWRPDLIEANSVRCESCPRGSANRST